MALLELAGDVLAGVVAASSTLSSPIDLLSAEGWTYCPEFQSQDGSGLPGNNADALEDLQCNQNPTHLHLSSVSAGFANGTITSINSSLPLTLAESIPNFLQMFSAAVLADMGIWNLNSLFLSSSTLNDTITPNLPIPSALAAGPSLGQLYSSQRAEGFGASEAEKFRSWEAPFNYHPSVTRIPIGDQNGTEAVIAISYLCTSQKIKSPVTFIIAVFVADASEFAAFWALFMFGATLLAKRRSHKVRLPAPAGRKAPSTSVWGT